MENENRFKLRISRMFRSSFGSCRPRNVSDVIEKAVFVPHQIPRKRHSSQQLPPSPPKPRPFSSICRPACPDPTRTINNTCIVSARDVARRSRTRMRPRVTEERSPFSHVNGRFYQRTEKVKKRGVIKKKRKNQRRPLLSSSSQDTSTTDYNFYCRDWFSSDDEREDDDDVYETDTVFSSRSTLSSDSSPHLRRRSRRHRRHRPKNTSSRRWREKRDDLLPLDESNHNMKDSFAVVKRSSDPYSDFRTSMVEMIVERQIFGAAELEKLLECFLSLNSTHHHGIIVEVFKEIWETLFCDLP